MNVMRVFLAAVVLAAGGSFFAARAASPIVQLDGSSTVYPIAEAVAEEFQKAEKGTVRVTVGISGTGGGFKKFCRGEIDVTNASRPILKNEMADCAKNGVAYIELPIAYDALTIVVNKQNNWVDYLTVEELKKMWEPAAQGQITNWKQIRDTFPDAPLQLFGAGADSGTFDYFTEAVTGKSKALRGDFTASEDDNVLVQGVSRNRHALGYFGFAYYHENADKLKAIPIAPKAGAKPVSPSIETVNNGSYQPLSRPVFIYVSAKSAARPDIKRFVEFFMREGAALAEEVGYVALPASAYELALKNFNNSKVGTAFGGHSEVGVKVEELLKREGRL